MKTTFLTLLIFLFLALSSSAQNLAFVQLNTKGCKFGKMTEEEMVSRNERLTPEHWNETKAYLRNAIISELNKKPKKWVFGHDKDANYTVTFVIEKIASNGYITGRAVLEYYRPNYHKLFYETTFEASGDSTKDFSMFSDRSFRKAVRIVRSLLIKHLNNELKLQRKKSYNNKMEKIIGDNVEKRTR